MEKQGGNGCKRQVVVESPVRPLRFLVRPCFIFLLFLSTVIVIILLGFPDRFSQTDWWKNLSLYTYYHRWTNPDRHRGPSPTTIPPTTVPAPTSTTIRPLPTNHNHLGYPRNYHFIVDEPDKCNTQTPFLVLIVPVAPGNLAARDAIRRTWGNETLVQGKKVQTLFMLGLPGGPVAQELQEKVNQESQVHHDLLQSNFLDSYLNLTIKTMVIMDWLATHCTNATYAMKIDSDMFLNVENLMTMLLRPDVPEVNYLTGMLMWNRPVIRNPNSKWYVPVEMLADDRYPTYTLGMGYVFSNDLPERFVAVSKDIKLFNIEDAYVGACMKKLGLSPTNSPDPWQWKAYLGKYNRCEFSKVITYILSRSSQIVEYWMDLKKTPGSPCH
ncbi:beta-1,3-galactosyltransferase 2-like [Oncorhynchus nerka]|uniref:beta-1,3-galactosyltransferase 2-like n=1 Tax=Oncorhynchus nerka TaxID=8023 RepID=UPI0011314B82|nr:beta-1,3-galactosyltransferase 2-like [Oncorhynchus nerka]